MDRCEELAANFGLNPRDVLRWPWVQVEEWWLSYAKRQRRKMKMEAILRGADPTGSGAGTGVGATAAATSSAGMKVGQVPGFIYSEWGAQGKEVRHTRATHADKALAVTERPPTDADDWDIPPHEVSKLAMLFPGAVKSVQT